MHCESDNICHRGPVTIEPDAAVCANPTVNRNIDILFVIDNSAGMAEEQLELITAFPVFLNELAGVPGGLPDLHIGVVSSNMGALGEPVAGCAGSGDQGQLQHSARTPGCAVPQGSFISDIGSPTGRVRNYTTTLNDTFACIARLGVNGCGFEQHLESMKTSLGPLAANVGFLRADAKLAVIILADEDDCSAQPGSAIFRMSATQFGALSSYRCFQAGVKCNPDLPATTLGERNACVSREDSADISAVRSFADFLKGLKSGGAADVFVGVLVGDATPVSVMTNPNNQSPQLAPSCTSATHTAVPAIRLAELARGFGAEVASICASDYSDALRGFAAGIIRKMESCQP